MMLFPEKSSIEKKKWIFLFLDIDKTFCIDYNINSGKISQKHF